MKLYKSMKSIGVAVAAISLSIGTTVTMALPVEVDFADPEVKGSYYGLVYGADMTTPVGVLNLKLSKKGSFSARLASSSTEVRLRMKGKMAPDGSYTGEQRNVDNIPSATSMQIAMAGPGYHRLTGVFTAPDDSKQYFELKRGIYSRAMPTTLADRYTMLVPSLVTESADIPAGDGVAYGKVTANGKVQLRGYSNAGNKFSYSGVIIEDDMVAFYTKPKNRDVEALLGTLHFRDIVGVSDLDGDLFHTQEISRRGGYYADGYSQKLPSIGSRYIRPASSKYPVNGYLPISSNAMASFIGGFHDATNYVFTWTPKGRQTAPKQPLYSTSAKMKNSRGYFSGQYVAYDADDSFSKSKSTLRGVVLQKQDTVSGQAITGAVSGRYVIEANDSGEIAPTTFVTPRKKNVSASVASYVIRVFVESAWQVVIPEDASWVRADVASGVGDGEVVITIESNFTGLPREAKVLVAGLAHKIKQDFRNDDGVILGGGVAAAAVTITPTTYLVTDWLGGETYDIAVVSDGDWEVSVPVGSAWIQATPSSGTGDGTVTVTVGTNPFFFTRTGTVLVGDAIHRVSQWP